MSKVTRFLAGEVRSRRRGQWARGTSRRVRVSIEALEPRTVLSTITTPIVSEFLASNSQGLRDEFDEASDWIELYNPTDQAIDLAGWGLTDNANRPFKWSFPADIVIGPGEFLVVFASNQDQITPGGEIHTNFALSAGGEYIGLIMPDGTVVHSYEPEYPPQTTDVSYGVAFVDGIPDLDQLLYFETPTPGLPNGSGTSLTVEPVSFSVPHGFYNEPILVSLETETTGATIRYTLDGSEPTADHGTIFSGPIEVGQTTTLRAGAFKQGGLAPPTIAQTYIFLTDVIHQSPNGETPPGWPATWGDHVVDVGMDPTIVNHPEYGGEVLIAALSAIPSISLTTDLAHLFDPETGIYANSLQSGRAWERLTSVELVNPDGAEGFQINAGLRIRGTGSADPSNPKHSFRLFFRNDYGASALEFPLFGEEGGSYYEKMDLRTAQNYSWSFEGRPNSNFIAEVFARDTMRDMGQPYTRSRFYHLYLNGQYWGLYQTEERPSKEYAPTYFGGHEDDYDVIRPDSETLQIGATDGDLDAWKRFWQAVVAPGGLGSPEAYYALQGLNPDSTENPSYEVFLDVDNLIDYMTTIFYIGNLDGPITILEDTGPLINNFFAIRNRAPDARQGFQFIMRDAEFSLLKLDENRLGPYDFGAAFGVFNPQYLHEQLLANPDYVKRFAERAAEHLAPGGALSPEMTIARFQARAMEIDQAVIAESARWGDAQWPGQPLTRAHWIVEINRILTNYLPFRTAVVADQFRAAGLLPPLPGGGNGDGDPPPTPGHYGGEDRTDLALFRRDAGKGTFLVSFAGEGGVIREFGEPGDIPITGDFDGDGIADFALFRPNSRTIPGAAEWFILPSGGGPAYSVLFGAAGGLDLPAPADYDGDGITDLAVFRPVSDLVPGAAQWFILPSGGGPAYSVLFGAAGGLDLPAPADYDGDGRADIATFRPSSDLVPGAAQWFILPSSSNDLSFSGMWDAYAILFGEAGVDQPVPLDYNGDGRADIATFRPTTAEWFILRSGLPLEQAGLRVEFGEPGDIPVPAYYRGESHAELAVFRPTTTEWIVMSSAGGPDIVTSFGEAGDVPILSPLSYRRPVPAAVGVASFSAASPGGPAVGEAGAARRIAPETFATGGAEQDSGDLGHPGLAPGRFAPISGADRPFFRSRPRDVGAGTGAGARPFVGLRQIGDLRLLRPGMWLELATRRDD